MHGEQGTVLWNDRHQRRVNADTRIASTTNPSTPQCLDRTNKDQELRLWRGYNKLLSGYASSCGTERNEIQHKAFKHPNKQPNNSGNKPQVVCHNPLCSTALLSGVASGFCWTQSSSMDLTGASYRKPPLASKMWRNHHVPEVTTSLGFWLNSQSHFLLQILLEFVWP